MIRAQLAALAVAAAACAPPIAATPAPAGEPQTAAEATAQDACGASRYQHLIGALASEIDRTTLPERARVITPDIMVTQDFRPGRLNIIAGTDGRVASLACY
jgi:hypothetical protein